MAKNNNINVEMLIVNDDCALDNDNDKSIGARGIAGTVLIHKIIGALAFNGAHLNEIYKIGQEAINNTLSMGIAFSSCTLISNPTVNRIKTNTMEVGLGIHGESGIGKKDFISCDTSVRLIIDHILNRNNNIKDTVVLINNLGGCTSIEMYIICKNTIEYLISKNISIKRIYNGSLMTALDMKGFSITLLNIKNDDKYI